MSWRVRRTDLYIQRICFDRHAWEKDHGGSGSPVETDAPGGGPLSYPFSLPAVRWLIAAESFPFRAPGVHALKKEPVLSGWNMWICMKRDRCVFPVFSHAGPRFRHFSRSFPACLKIAFPHGRNCSAVSPPLRESSGKSVKTCIFPLENFGKYRYYAQQGIWHWEL